MMRRNQGCQMVYLPIKILILVHFLKVFEWKIVVYFIAFWSFGTSYIHWVYIHWVFFAFWYIVTLDGKAQIEDTSINDFCVCCAHPC
jgi:hypothetical protein